MARKSLRHDIYGQEAPIWSHVDETKYRKVDLFGIIGAWTGMCFPRNHHENSNQGNFGDIRDVLDYMVGEALYTHAYIRASKESAQYFEDQFPALRWIKDNMKHWIWDINFRDHPRSCWRQMQDLENTYGRFHVLIPMPKDDHDVIDPFQELINMGVDPNKIISFDPNEEKHDTYGNLPPKDSRGDR